MQPVRIALADAEIVGARREGAGNPLILVHGFGGSRHDWEAVIAALPADRPLIAYDQRGFGNSPVVPDKPFSHAEDLLGVMDALGIDRADLCGLSLGGGTVLNFALNHPERVRRLVMVSPLMVGWSWSRDWIERWKAIGRAARGGDIERARALWWDHPLFETTRESSGSEHLRAAIAAFHGSQWIEDHQRPESPETERLAELSVPTLLLTGSHDTPDFRLMADCIDAASRHVQRIDHAGAGHLLNLEIADQIAAEITAFLQ